ncbi:unknown [Acidaminococcus intestini CAG:325]|nr:unknown [Acidaminococcus intestini CAG:325]
MIEPACQFQEKQDPRNRSPDRAREKAGHGKDHHMEPIFRRQKAKACSKVTVKASADGP